MEDTAVDEYNVIYRLELVERKYATLPPWWNGTITKDGEEVFWGSGPTKESVWDMMQEYMWEELSEKKDEE